MIHFHFARLKRVLALVFMGLGAVVFASSASAASKALLLGSSYADTASELPGILTDLKRMQFTVTELGFSRDNIRILANEDLTRSNVELGFEWLSAGTAADDTVLVYFSGHGTQVRDKNGDEADGFDEAWVLHDTNSEYELLVDDRLSDLLERIPSERKRVIVDACCSGTGHRSVGTDEFHVKSMCPVVRENGIPADRVFGDDHESDDTTLIYFSAAQDSEFALATSDGSLFTRAIFDAVQDPAYDNTVSPLRLHQFATQHIADRLVAYPEKRHTPSLVASPVVSNSAGAFVATTVASASDLPSAMTVAHSPKPAEQSVIEMLSPQAMQTLAPGDSVLLDIAVEEDGYLNLLALDANKQIKVIYPNRFSPDSRRVYAGDIVHLPEGFELIATEPLGETAIIALHTRTHLNLHQRSQTAEGTKSVETDFLTLTKSAAKALGTGVEVASSRPSATDSAAQPAAPAVAAEPERQELEMDVTSFTFKVCRAGDGSC